MIQKSIENIHKGDVFYADLGENVGSEQNGIRPVLVIQNDLGNKYSPTLIVSPLTTKNKKLSLATHVCLGDVNGRKSMALLEQIRTIDRCRLLEYGGNVSSGIAGTLPFVIERLETVLAKSVSQSLLHRCLSC